MPPIHGIEESIISTVIGRSGSYEPITPAALAASAFKGLIERLVYSQSTLCF